MLFESSELKTPFFEKPHFYYSLLCIYETAQPAFAKTNQHVFSSIRIEYLLNQSNYMICLEKIEFLFFDILPRIFFAKN